MNPYLAAVLIPLQRTLTNVVSFFPRMLLALLLFSAFIAAATLFRQIARRVMAKMPHLPWAVPVLVARSVYLGTLFLGLLAALSAIDVNVSAIIASLGIVGFAVSFALKDILENFVSGFLLLFARPFDVGDQISSGTFDGTVVDIQLRSTTLQTYDNQIVVIPNSQVYTSPVVNHTRLGKRLYSIDFDTSLKVDTQKVLGLIPSAAENIAGAFRSPEPSVRIIKVDRAADVLSWRLYIWGKPAKADEMVIVSDAFSTIKAQLYDIDVPAPTPAAPKTPSEPVAEPSQNAASK